jgi:hypothetical protein
MTKALLTLSREVHRRGRVPLPYISRITGIQAMNGCLSYWRGLRDGLVRFWMANRYGVEENLSMGLVYTEQARLHS